MERKPRFKVGERAILMDIADDFGEVEVIISNKQFVAHPEVWGYDGRPQYFYTFDIVKPSNIELSYKFAPQSFFRKLKRC